MIVKQYIKDFEKLGFGMFVHFGPYSAIGRAEWSKKLHNIDEAEYDTYSKQFQPKSDWAVEIAKLAKRAGCKYITLTTRHHDGYSLYDTCGLNDYDAPHSCGRDLVREFVDACHTYDLIPFFYHTLIDWYNPSDKEDFPAYNKEDFSAYLDYLRKSVEILCTNYGKIGGIWFDGMWAKPKEVWEEDALYSMIRKHQPEAMIINNTGLLELGALGHIELDSVTFERGKPKPINMEGAPKYVASEMCEVMASHWGYAREDLHFKSPTQMIRELAECRRYGCNMLMNIGPMGDGTLRSIEVATFELMGQWMDYYKEAIYVPRPTGIEIEGKERDFILKDGKNYYLFCYGIPMKSDPNVALRHVADYSERFKLEDKIVNVTWMDNDEVLRFDQEGEDVTVYTSPFAYGRDLVVRVAKIVCE